jgi:hypothetical protein
MEFEEVRNTKLYSRTGEKFIMVLYMATGLVLYFFRDSVREMGSSKYPYPSK